MWIYLYSIEKLLKKGSLSSIEHFIVFKISFVKVKKSCVIKQRRKLEII